MRSTSGDPTPGEADFGTTAAGSNPAISQRVVVFATITCFLAWAFSVYDYTLFGILLPVIATDLGWSTAFSTAVNSYVGIGMFGRFQASVTPNSWSIRHILRRSTGNASAEALYIASCKAGSRLAF